MQSYKTLTAFPEWAARLTDGDSSSLGGSAAAYQAVPLVYRALNLRMAALSAVPFRLLDGDQEIKWDDKFYTPLKTLLRWTEASLMLTGSAYWLHLDKGNRRLGAQWLNPYTIQKVAKQSKDVTGVTTEVTYFQQTGTVKLGPWSEDQVTHFRTFNPRDDLVDGIAPAQVAMQSADLMYYMKRFATRFFEGGAMPITILGIEGNPQAQEIKAVEGFFRRMAVGVRNAFNVLGLRGSIKPTVITPELNTLAMPELRQQALEDVCHAFGIPQTMLTDAANYATAAEHRRSFYEETINPEADWIAETITSQFLEPTGLKLEAHPEEMDIFQEDEAQRAGSVAALTAAGIDLVTALEVLGYELSEEQWDRVKAGANTPEPVSDDRSEPQQQDDEPDEMEAEMRRWKRKALKAVSKGKSAAVPFETEVIPTLECERIAKALTNAETAEDVKRVFDMSVDTEYLAAELRRANDLLSEVLGVE
jgi:HK97 family phage portal protein